MHFSVGEMDETAARAVLDWRYPEPYSFYDTISTDIEQDLREMLDGSLYAVTGEDGRLAGFVSFGPIAQVPGGHPAGAYTDPDLLDIGLGLRPDLTGQGAGLAFIQTALEFGRRTYNPAGFRLSVATFNQRAITVYERAGFERGITFLSPTRNDETEFLSMTRHNPA